MLKVSSLSTLLSIVGVLQSQYSLSKVQVCKAQHALPLGRQLRAETLLGRSEGPDWLQMHFTVIPSQKNPKRKLGGNFSNKSREKCLFGGENFVLFGASLDSINCRVKNPGAVAGPTRN